MILDEDSGFFDDPTEDDTVSTVAAELIFSSENSWCQLYRIDKAGRFRVYKVLSPQYRGQERYEALLKKEFNIGYSLQHPNICEIFSYCRLPGLGNAIEMEWIDGRALTSVIESGKLNHDLSRKIIFQLCDALNYLHNRQVIHRDIKPSNILITNNGDNVKLIDFGFSDTDSHLILKTPGGTQSFAAPELLSGEKIDNRADIYSLGKVISFLSKRYRTTVKRCTAADPDQRFSDINDVRKSIERTNRVGIIVAFALIVIIAVAAFFHYYLKPESNPEIQTEETLITDPAAIDELFFQATEMIDGQ